MGLLKPLGLGQGYLKAGFLGFNKSGKTFTSALLALGTRTFMGLDGPIAMFDTETGSEYIGKQIREGTGKDLMGVRSRSFSDLVQMARECEKEGVSVLIADSMTHVWRELCDAHLKQVNDQRKGRRLPPRNRLEFQDWGVIKGKWAEWTDFYLNSKLHIIIAGRAGYEYDYEENEETGKKELMKTGIKMKTEGEFGFEPSLLVEMERITKTGSKDMLHRATILGDRFNLIDGKVVDNPTFDFFKPHIQALTPGAHAPVDTEVKTNLDYDEFGDSAFHQEKKRRTIACEEVQGLIVSLYPGQTAAEKKAKSDLLDDLFGTRSWTMMEDMGSKGVPMENLITGLAQLRAKVTELTGGAPPSTGVNGEAELVPY